MTRTWLPPLGGLVALAAIAAFGVAVNPAAAPARQLRAAAQPLDTVTVVCPDVTGTRNGLRTTMTVTDADAVASPSAAQTSLSPTSVSYQLLTGAPGRGHVLPDAATQQLTRTTAYGAVAVTARGARAARIAVDQIGLQETGRGRGLSDVPCAAPGTDWWFAGADGRIGRADTLFVANPSDALANVAIGLWGPKGRLPTPGVSSLPVPPRSSLLLRVSDLAPDSPDLAVHVHATSGTVAVALFDQRTAGVNPLGTDWVPATGAPAVTAVVAGYAPGPGARYLLLANPGSRDATVTLRVVTRTGNFQPAGHQSVVVPAGRTLTQELSSALGGEPGALVMNSDQPVVAEGVSIAFVAHRYEDVAWHPASTPITTTAVLPANAPPFGQRSTLLLTAPDGAVRVRLMTTGGVSRIVTVPAGRTVQVDLRAALGRQSSVPGPVVLEPLTSQPVYGSRILFAEGAHGPLITSEVPAQLPTPLVVPAAVEDLRAALG
jgi:hypothetical protein